MLKKVHFDAFKKLSHHANAVCAASFPQSAPPPLVATW
jgi:hypothetical protein